LSVQFKNGEFCSKRILQIKKERNSQEGPDDIPGWLLKKNADLLAPPIMDVMNSSFREGRLPLSWKEADIVPIPKQRPIQDVNKHLDV